MISVKTERTVHRRLSDVIKKLEAKVAPSLLAAGQVLIEESLKLVPRDTEALANSAVVRQLPGSSGFDSVIIVGYAHPDVSMKVLSPKEGIEVTRVPAEYAVYVHEGNVGRGPPAPHPPGQINFLRTPHAVNRPEMIAALNIVWVSS